MDRNFLLTYITKEKRLEYGWFESEDELQDFIEENEDDILEINDAIEVCQAREIEL